MIVHLALYQVLGLLLTAYCLGMLTLLGLAAAAARRDRAREQAFQAHLAAVDYVDRQARR